jgi:hypothetical protein
MCEGLSEGPCPELRKGGANAAESLVQAQFFS